MHKATPKRGYVIGPNRSPAYDLLIIAGLAKLTLLGAHAIAQDRKSSIVFGMPKAAIEHGCVAEVLPLSAIGPLISDLLLAGDVDPRASQVLRSG